MPSNMNDLIRQAQKMQEQMAGAQTELDEKLYSTTAGGGMVSVEMNGKHEITALSIKPEVVDPDDIEMLSDLITGAVNECIRKVDSDRDSTMAAISGGMPQIG